MTTGKFSGARPSLTTYIRRLADGVRATNTKMERLRTDDRLWEHVDQADALLRLHLVEGIKQYQAMINRLDKPRKGRSSS